jgi:phosphoserine phosphatase
MNGEIDFKESLKRMALLEGLSEEVLQTVGWKSTYNKRSASLDETWNTTDIKRLFYQGFTFFGNYLKKLGIDYVH